jgi:hypothetical protein
MLEKKSMTTAKLIVAVVPKAHETTRNHDDDIVVVPKAHEMTRNHNDNELSSSSSWPGLCNTGKKN